jgi:hypothetical protein
MDRIVKSGRKALAEAAKRAAAEAAAQPHPRLTKDQRVGALDDLKEHLKLTGLLNRPAKGMKVQ